MGLGLASGRLDEVEVGLAVGAIQADDQVMGWGVSITYIGSLGFSTRPMKSTLLAFLIAARRNRDGIGWPLHGF
jgi:hypothetical protein